MRQRKAKDLESRLQRCSEYMARPPLPHGWRGCFENDHPLFLEIGCGKGNFIISKALAHPDRNFIAAEGQETVILRALEKARACEQEDRIRQEGRRLRNLRFLPAYIEDMAAFFEQDQLSGIFLNFSDPWPKARHAGRRLTHRKRLQSYGWVLKPGGFVEIKTDNDALYEFTLEEIAAVGYQVSEQTTDLHSSAFSSQYTTTEYEEKFRDRGKNINYVKITVK